MGFRGRRRGRADEVPADDTDDEGSARGGHVFRPVPGAPPTTLAEPLRTVRREAMRITPVPWDLEPDADYLLGGPGESTCEVVRTSPSGTTGPGRTRHVLRGRYGTLASPHPAGTPVTPVTAERVEDWSRWSGSPEGEPGPGRARDTGSSPGS